MEKVFLNGFKAWVTTNNAYCGVKFIRSGESITYRIIQQPSWDSFSELVHKNGGDPYQIMRETIRREWEQLHWEMNHLQRAKMLWSYRAGRYMASFEVEHHEGRWVPIAPDWMPFERSFRVRFFNCSTGRAETEETNEYVASAISEMDAIINLEVSSYLLNYGHG